MQQSQSQQCPYRRKVAYVSQIGITQLHLRNPWTIAWWSAAFPGAGHLLLSKYMRGFLLFGWESFVNLQAHINEAIFYSFMGKIDQAKMVIDRDWALLYVATLMFTIWDSYRTTVDLNNIYILAAREDAEIQPFTITGFEINYLEKRSPLDAVLWSLLSPGVGQLYIHRVIVGAFSLVMWILNCYMSKVLPAIHYSLLGQFEQAKSILDIHWILNIASLYTFAIYDAYVNTVENNKLYDWEQSKFFKRKYQCTDFRMPMEYGKLRSEGMYIIATFEYNHFLERAVTGMQMQGVAKERILAAPLDKRGEERRLFDTMHYSDGLSLIDLAAVLGTIFMLFGTIYGFVLLWGPIWWGLIGLATGCVIGVIIKLITTKIYAKDRTKAEKAPEVVLIIECEQQELETVHNVLWDNHALGVSKLDLGKISAS